MRALDRTHGGFLEDERDGVFFDRGEKCLKMQARQLYAFSLFSENDPQNSGLIEASHHGFEFLSTVLRDGENGGFYNAVAPDGTPMDRSRPFAHHFFAILGLATFARVFGRDDARALACEVFREFDARAYDERNGGYCEGLGAEWQRLTADEINPRDRSFPGVRSFESELHQAEALAALYRVSPEDGVRRRLEELLLRCLTCFRHPRSTLTINSWDADLDRPYDLRGSQRAAVGHDMEHVLLVLETLRSLELPLTSVRNWALQQSGEAIQSAWDRKYGGFYTNANFQAPRQLGRKSAKAWWVQSDCMICLLELYVLTARLEYFRLFRRCFDFIEEHLIRSDGGWRQLVDRSGASPIRSIAASSDHGAYHSARALLRSQQVIRGLADAPD
ncbi:MAG: AGE family epimerase/isomerase [Pseudomonadota bacterium]